MVRRENFSLPTRREHFREKIFSCPFQYPKVPLVAGAPPPQSFDASYALARKVISILGVISDINFL